LTADEQAKYQVESLFDPFRVSDSFLVNEFANLKWKNQKAQYEKLLEPIEKEISSKLRKEIMSDESLSAT
jgi:hypothetical protein